MIVNDSTLRGMWGELGELIAKHGEGQNLDQLQKYADDPVGFAREVLHLDPWAKQAELLELVRDNPYTWCLSANGVGKTCTLAAALLWWLFARGPSVVVSVAPTDRQNRELLWGEVRRLFLNATPTLPGELFTSALRVSDRDKWYAIGFSTTTADRLVGFHADKLLVLADEAQGLDAGVWEGLHAIAVGADNRIVAIGNPGGRSGPWYNVTKSNGWQGLTISAMQHPNIITGRNVIPGAVSKAFVARMGAEYGTGSSVFYNRVLGRFADDDTETLCRRSWLLAAAERSESQDLEHLTRNEPLVAALDPARYGPDSTCLVIRQGPVLRSLTTWRHLDLMGTCGRVVTELRKHDIGPRQRVHVPEEHRGWMNDAQVSVGGERIVIDEVGVGGGIVDRLREQNYRVSGYNGGRSPKRPTFANLRAESHWHLRTLLEQGQIALPHDEELFDELVAIRWRATSAGKIQIEPKEELKNRLGRSPDRADAVVLAFSGWQPRKARSTEAVHWG